MLTAILESILNWEYRSNCALLLLWLTHPYANLSTLHGTQEDLTHTKNSWFKNKAEEIQNESF